MKNGTLIIGGGVVGLGIGWKLAQRGEAVTLLERGETGREASWAAAGMLAPATEVHFQEDANLFFGRESMRLYPDFVAELQEFTGIDVDYRTDGALAVALDADHAAAMRNLFDYQRERNLPVRWLTGDEVREMEPSLSPYVTAGVICPMDHQVDNRLLMDALKAAFSKAGGELREHSALTGLRRENGGYQGITAAGEVEARRVLLAAGSWSALVPDIPEQARPPVRPVKGQMLSLRAPDEKFLRHVIRAPHGYAAPKRGGKIVFGATAEEMGFDRRLTAGGLYSLLKAAWETVPGTYELPVEEMWCGFRPGSRDNAPIIGESEVPGLFMATGHFRNGILFAPATAVHMATLLLEGRTPEPLLPFNPRRFSN